MQEFSPGKIFGKNAIQKEAIAAKISLREAYKNHRRAAYKFRWPVWNTPLYLYGGKFSNLDQHLEKLAIQARQSKQKLKILGIGIGSAHQWAEFMQRNHDVIELHGTGIEAKPDPEIPLKFIKTTASRLHKKYPANYFDLIITHLGMHHEEMQGIENIVHILKPNGQAIISAQTNKPKLPTGYRKHFKLLKIRAPDKSPIANWTYHIQKIDPNKKWYHPLVKLFHRKTRA